MRIRVSSDVCSSDLLDRLPEPPSAPASKGTLTANYATEKWSVGARARHFSGYYLFYKNLATGEYPVNVNQGSNRIPGATFIDLFGSFQLPTRTEVRAGINNLFNKKPPIDVTRSEAHTSELQSLMRTSYAVFC